MLWLRYIDNPEDEATLEEIAKKLKDEKMPIDKIVKITGLSKEEIEKL